IRGVALQFASRRLNAKALLVARLDYRQLGETFVALLALRCPCGVLAASPVQAECGADASIRGLQHMLDEVKDLLGSNRVAGPGFGEEVADVRHELCRQYRCDRREQPALWDRGEA